MVKHTENIVGLLILLFVLALASAAIAWGFGFNCRPFIGFALAFVVLLAPLLFSQFKKPGATS